MTCYPVPVEGEEDGKGADQEAQDTETEARRADGCLNIVAEEDLHAEKEVRGSSQHWHKSCGDRPVNGATYTHKWPLGRIKTKN